MTVLYDHGQCGCDVCLADGDFTPEETLNIDKTVEKALKKIYTGTYKGEFPEELWAITVNKLNEAVNTEFGKEFKPLANQLKYQNSVFAAFKAANQTQTLENLLTASKSATFTDFAETVRSKVKDYNHNYLKAEWATAKMAARSAKRWARALEDADIFPNIEYLPSTAKEPRDKHKGYYGMIRPIKDPIWATMLPPLDWVCHCQWRSTDMGATKAPTGLPSPSPGLDNNPCNDGALFSQSHPYYTKAIGQAEPTVQSDLAAIEGVDPSEIIVHDFDKKSKGVIYSTEKITDNAVKENTITASYHMEKGASVKLINIDEKAGRDLKTPDTIVNGMYNEFKRSTVDNPGFENIKTDLKDTHKKGKRLNQAIDVTLRYSNADKKTVQRAVHGKENAKQIDFVANIYIVNNEKMFGPFSKKQIIDGKFDIK